MPAIMQPDPRFEAVLNLIRSGEFGWEGYFAQLIGSLNGSSDYYLLANDFPSYLEAQVCLVPSQKTAGQGSVTAVLQHVVKLLSRLHNYPDSLFVCKQLRS